MGESPGGPDKYYCLVAMTDGGRQQVDCHDLINCFDLYDPLATDHSAVSLLNSRNYDTVDSMTGGLEWGRSITMRRASFRASGGRTACS